MKRDCSFGAAMNRGTPDPSTSTYRQMVDCPNEAEHTYGPHGYMAWHHWADQMKKTHRQSKCPGCGLYLILRPKNSRS